MLCAVTHKLQSKQRSPTAPFVLRSSFQIVSANRKEFWDSPLNDVTHLCLRPSSSHPVFVPFQTYGEPSGGSTLTQRVCPRVVNRGLNTLLSV